MSPADACHPIISSHWNPE